MLSYIFYIFWLLTAAGRLWLAKSLERLDALETELDVALGLLLVGKLAQSPVLEVTQDVQCLGFFREDQPEGRVGCRSRNKPNNK